MSGNQERAERLRSMAVQQANQASLARQCSEQELLRAKQALQSRTDELGKATAREEMLLSDLARAREETERLRCAAQDGIEAKSRFLRMISHELRTPLGAIGGFAALISEGIYGPVNPAQSESLARIQHNQQRLLGLVNELLDMASIEAGEVNLHLADSPVQPILANVTALVANQAREKGLTLHVDDADPKLAVHADAHRVEQILHNLLSNAMKFTAHGGAITLAAVPISNTIEIRVQDTGIGIAADQLEAVFDSFSQVAPSLGESGVGLGLAISRQLARSMGGDLTAESVYGVGSTFRLRLTAADLDQAMQQAPLRSA